MNTTSFSLVYDSFLSKITDDMYLERNLNFLELIFGIMNYLRFQMKQLIMGQKVIMNRLQQLFIVGDVLIIY